MKPHIRVGIIGDGSHNLTRSALTAALAQRGLVDTEGINIVDLPEVTTKEAERMLTAMDDAKDFDKHVIIVDSLSCAEAEMEKRRRDRERGLLDTKVAIAGLMAMNSMMFYPPGHHLGISSLFPRRAEPKMVKCDLPRCDVLHSHNGGYCCPEHCKEHRGKK